MFAPKQGLSSIKVDCCSTVGHVVAYDMMIKRVEILKKAG